MGAQLVAGGRFLNHLETVYRPGERHLVAKLFETLGCRVRDRGGAYLSISVDKASTDLTNNTIYASEVTPEQWRFEQALQCALSGESEVAAGFRGYDALLERNPQRTTHFGIRFPSVGELEETLRAVERAAAQGELAGRVRVSGVYRPGDAGALSDQIVQAFVKTDVCAAGLVCLGQHIELQALAR